MIDNPIELPISEDRLECIHAFARDLVYGALKGYWDSKIIIDQKDNWIYLTKYRNTASHSPDEDIFVHKWYPQIQGYSVTPSLSLLVSFGYLEKIGERGEKKLRHTTQFFPVDDSTPAPFEIEYILTPKAFALLEKPFTPPKVFISYKRDYSSAFALLLEARLKLKDPEISIFIDKLIVPGTDWAKDIEEKVRGSEYCICLFAPKSFEESVWMQKELEWAFDAGCKIIALFHNDCHLDDTYPDQLKKVQVITVDYETTKHYESAIDDVMVGMGYSTY